MLTKNVPRVFIKGSPGVPATPGSPFKPAWDEIVKVQNPNFRIGGRVVKAGGRSLTYAGGVPMAGVKMPDGTVRMVPVLVADIYNGYVNEKLTEEEASQAISNRFGGALYTEVVVRHPPEPAVAPTPAKKATKGQWIALNGLAWDAGAYSRTRLDGDVETTFKIPDATGVVIGFVRAPVRQNYRVMSHGLYFHSGFVVPIEQGVPVGPTLTFLPSDTFAIRRVQGQVRYAKNNAEFYTSTVKSAGSLVVEAVLYGAADRVD